ncbi:MAG: ASKHA domain-containing protein [Coriobacteriia bacterium]|nr:ASKHA domain-containing protein [Coriobacteriia bacterium]
MSTYQITIRTEDDELLVEADSEKTVLEVIQEAKLVISATCGGNGTCGKCMVYVHEGGISGLRLACRTHVSDQMIIELAGPQTMIIEEDALVSSYVPDTGLTGLGIALDIGTTTLACRLFDRSDGSLLASAARINPQAVWGADVISRIDASVDGKLEAMQEAVLDAINQMVDELLSTARRRRRDISDFTIAANTVMQHIAAGLAPDSIGVNPFTPLSLFGDYHDLPLLNIPCQVWFTPCLASYVGGDITAGIIASDMHKAERKQVLIDLGTNGEMALGDKNGIIACATAAGPVFEGANIHFGMAALPGAISVAWEEDGVLKFDTIGGAEPKGLCGTGIIDIAACLYKNGIFDETGYLYSADECPKYADRLGEEDGVSVFYLTEDKSLYLTQKDIRNIQLGISAVYSGLMVLLDTAGIGIDDIDHLDIAGGFGKYINKESAAILGLFPKAWLDRTNSIGNSSVEGASAVLLSSAARNDTQNIHDLAEYIELSLSPKFNEYFVENMMFPED